MIKPDKSGLYHPRNEKEIVELIQHAVKAKLQVRVRGAAQSPAASVFADGFDPSQGGGKNINIQLDQIRSVVINKKKKQVTVGAGCNLGQDPGDPTNPLSGEKGLLVQLDKNGLALPNVPDEIHQTIGGFISTGSAGGSMTHSFDACIVSVRMIDGTGAVRTFSKSRNVDDPFYGVVVSMGLLGIITSVTLQCVPAYNVAGIETTTFVPDCPYDFLGKGDRKKPGAMQFLNKTEFTRTMWWPFKALNRVVVWQAKKLPPSTKKFSPKPYLSIFPSVGGSTMPAETVASAGFTLIASWPTWFYQLLGLTPQTAPPIVGFAQAGIEKAFPVIYPVLINMFMPVNNPSSPAKQFQDLWYRALPMDKAEFSNSLFNLAYAEMWMPVDKTHSILNAMQTFYNQKGFAATGFFTTEIFAAKSSNFWLSPAYKQDSVRINLLWFGAGIGDPMAYFQEFWTLLAKYKYRPHWGKSLPPADRNGNSVKYLRSRYPRWSQWMKLRNQMDPHQLFVTSYWRSQLGIPTKG